MPRQVDQLPADSTSLARRVAALERQLRELRAAPRLAAATAKLIQTASSGSRVALDGDGPAFLIYDDDETLIGRFGPDPVDGGAGLWTRGQQEPFPLLAYLYGGEMRWRPVDENSVTEDASAVYDTDANTFADLIFSSGRVYSGDIPARIVLTTDVGGGQPVAGVEAILKADNWAIGTTTITPSAANTPTSLAVTGLNVKGSTFYAFAAPQTAAPGTNVTGVGTNGVTGSGLTVWVTRTNTTPTVVNWMVIGL